MFLGAEKGILVNFDFPIFRLNLGFWKNLWKRRKRTRRGDRKGTRRGHFCHPHKEST
jgi:hypothetical protein